MTSPGTESRHRTDLCELTITRVCCSLCPKCRTDALPSSRQSSVGAWAELFVEDIVALIEQNNIALPWLVGTTGMLIVGTFATLIMIARFI